MRIYIASERVRHPCFGVVGGLSGTPGKVLKNGEPHSAKGKAILAPNDRLHVETPGGGGWGRASERSVDLIEQDLVDGLITPEAARRNYGYVGPAVLAAE